MLALMSCGEYDEDQVYRAVKEAFLAMGGMGKTIKPGMRVMIKPNMVRAMAPDRHATTHPFVVLAAARLIKEAGAYPIIAESPGGPYNKAWIKSTYATCGILALAKEHGIDINLDVETYFAHIGGKVLKSTDFIDVLKDVDAVVSLPKLKTHCFTRYSGAVKNLFGLVPGAIKAEYHLRFPDGEDFEDMLLDIYQYVTKEKPVLHIMDAIIGMEGEGPTGGVPRFFGGIIAGDDGVEMDAFASDLIGLPIEKFPLLARANARGIPSGVQNLGMDKEVFRQTFSVPQGIRVVLPIKPDGFILTHMAWIVPYLQKAFTQKPRIQKVCVGCGVCKRDCPPKAIEIVHGKANIDKKKCIHCFCCQELCPHNAVKIQRSPFYRFIH